MHLIIIHMHAVTTASESSEDDEIGVGGIAGISVGAALLAVSAVIGILALIWYMRRRRKSRYMIVLKVHTYMTSEYICSYTIQHCSYIIDIRGGSRLLKRSWNCN